jgi:hypothetical protein
MVPKNVDDPRYRLLELSDSLSHQATARPALSPSKCRGIILLLVARIQFSKSLAADYEVSFPLLSHAAHYGAMK